MILRPMQLADVPAVMAIERASFSMTWPTSAYTYEIRKAHYSHLAVLGSEASPNTPLGRLLLALRRPLVLAYGGMWVIRDEAHISTLATHPKQRRKGYARLVMLALLVRAARIQASHAVLEVRVSNTGARLLYERMGFQHAHIKEAYYSDNQEDAHFMVCSLDDPTPFIAEYRTMLADFGVQDAFN